MQTVDLSRLEVGPIFDYLLKAARGGQVAPFTIDGKQERDLLKLALCLPDSPLSEPHGASVAEIFKKPQAGYRRTGVNLAHRHNQMVSDQAFKGRAGSILAGLASGEAAR
jgi:hypothetical protein